MFSRKPRRKVTGAAAAGLLDVPELLELLEDDEADDPHPAASTVTAAATAAAAMVRRIVHPFPIELIGLKVYSIFPIGNPTNASPRDSGSRGQHWGEYGKQDRPAVNRQGAAGQRS
jgi:hypothetical protein